MDIPQRASPGISKIFPTNLRNGKPTLDIPTECSKDVFDIMDANGDGLVSIDEFAEGFLEFWFSEDPNNIYNQAYGPLLGGVGPRFDGIGSPPLHCTLMSQLISKMPTDYPLLTGSAHWKRKARTIFQRLDANADGYMTKEDFVITAQNLIDFLGVKGEKVEHIMNRRLELWAAIAGDKTRLSEDEYCSSCLSLVNERHFRLELCYTFICTEFNTIDIDSDGFISKEEHAAYFHSVNIPTTYSKDNFAILDTDGDGLVSIDEFAESYLEFWLTEDPNNIYNQNYGPLVD
ncbi:mitrocomin-like [Lingula anatina]|uniref:Mitrocomin-like n=1 Tax=Lingula anatina TaxID=7574 RepID=A0A1S3IKL8_LINAN|nr:mitrocomin-like [Lingula anatina]|eukprot:XP_013398757.1 mitrocomin-like [Lingula anatina]